MAISGTLFDVFNTRRELLGRLVRDQIARDGLTVREAAALTHTSSPLLNRLFRGDPTVSEMSLRSIEGGFDWPIHFLGYILEGDIQAIEHLDLRPDLKQFVLREIENLPETIVKQDGHELDLAAREGENHGRRMRDEQDAAAEGDDTA